VLQGQAQPRQQALQQVMRRCGRQCRGMGQVGVTLVRQTETHWLPLGQQVLPLAGAAQVCLHGTSPLSAERRARLETQLGAALQAQHRITHQSRRLTPGKGLAHGKIVHAYAPTMAPMCTGTSHGPAQFGRKPGILAEPAAGFIFALQLPVGNPSAVRDVEPLIDTVEPALAQVRTRPTLAIPSLAGDLARNDAALREAWHARGILTVGIPTTIEPIPLLPTPADVLRRLDEADLPPIRPPTQVRRAYACGDRRPVVESVMASLLHRGAARLTYQGHRGAIIQPGMAVMAHNAAPLVRIHE
jgi:hypothetical protein